MGQFDISDPADLGGGWRALFEVRDVPGGKEFRIRGGASKFLLPGDTVSFVYKVDEDKSQRKKPQDDWRVW